MLASWASLPYSRTWEGFKVEHVDHPSPIALQAQKMVARKVRIIKDSPVCRRSHHAGFSNASRPETSICMSRIKAGSPWNYCKLIKEALLHESIHVVQACKARSGHLEPQGIRRVGKPLSLGRKDDLG